MTCGQAKELMAASWQGDLDRALEPAFRRHLDACAECGAEMAALGNLWEGLIDMPVPEPSQALHARWRSTLAEMVESTVPAERKSWLTKFWPRNPVWQVGIALACLLVGILAGVATPRRDNEIAKLHDEISSTRAIVALSLLQQQSATERLRGVNYTDRMKTMEPEVVSALVEAVSRDPNVNVRLAAIDALGKAAAYPGVLQSLIRALPRQDSPMVQAAIVDYLADAHDRQAVGTLRQLASQPDLNPAVLQRTNFALQQLSR